MFFPTLICRRTSFMVSLKSLGVLPSLPSVLNKSMNMKYLFLIIIIMMKYLFSSIYIEISMIANILPPFSLSSSIWSSTLEREWMRSIPLRINRGLRHTAVLNSSLINSLRFFGSESILQISMIQFQLQSIINVKW